MDRGVRKAGAAVDKDRRWRSVCGLTVLQIMEKKDLSFCKVKRMVPTESFHAWWLAQDGSEPRSRARARGGGIVSGGGGVGFETRRGGFVILSRERESKHNHNPGNQALCTDNLKAN